MTKSSASKGNLRAPVQRRSQQRVELILDACKELILENGCAALKIGDVAKTANISSASIYQYFPNKQAIVAALAIQYYEVLRAYVFEVLEEAPDDLDAMRQITVQLLDHSYRFHRDDLVVRDIWIGFATDKSLQEVIQEDSAMHLEFFFERSKHLFKPSKHEQVKQTLSLLIDFAKIAVYGAVELEEDEGKFKLEVAKGILCSCWEGSLKPLARTSKNASDIRGDSVLISNQA